MDKLQDRLDNMIECPICQEPFVDAKFLPCHHTLCNSCLKKLAAPGASIICPLCRQQYPVPAGGFQSNFYIHDLLEMKRILVSSNSEFVSLKATCENLRGLLGSSLSEETDLRQRLQSAEERLTETEQELVKRNEREQELLTVKNNYKRERNKLQDELQSQTLKLNSLRLWENAVKKVIRTTRKSEMELRSKVKVFKRRSVHMARMMEAMKRRHKEMLRELGVRTGVVRSLRQRMNDISQRCAEEKREYDRLKVEHEELVRKRKSAEHEVVRKAMEPLVRNNQFTPENHLEVLDIQPSIERLRETETLVDELQNEENDFTDECVPGHRCCRHCRMKLNDANRHKCLTFGLMAAAMRGSC